MHTHGISIVVDMGVGALVAGKYRIERVLSEGGMGCVVAARHIDLDELVAIKFLLPSALGNAEAVARFAQEARTAVKIRSEHVVRTLDVGTLDNGTPFIVMEYLDGSDLSVILREQGRLPVEQAVDFLLQTSEAIAEAHRIGIVHRDLKPANLFCIRQSGGTFLIKVLDFGISKVTDTQVAHPLAVTTNTAMIMGSPFYMSPEQLRSSRSVDVRSDIWSLGVILFELISGHLPFAAETLPELCLDITTKPPARLREYRPDIEPELEGVICKCLEKDRDARYSNIAEFALALAPFAPERRTSSIERVCGMVASSSASVQALSGATLLRNSDDRLLAAVPVDWFGSRDTRALHSAPTPSAFLACSQLRVAPFTSDSENKTDYGSSPLPTEASVFPAVLHSATDNDSSQFSACFEKPRRTKWRSRLTVTLCALVFTVGAVRALSPLPRTQTRVRELVTHALALLQSPQDTITVTAAGPGLIPIESVEVLIDGKKRCDSSPCVATRVGIGTHLVAIRATGYLTPSPQAVAAGNHLNLLLTPVSNSGYLKVSAVGSDLKLALDGRDLGALRTEPEALSPGAHQLRIDGGPRFETYEQTVWVASNEVTTVGPIRLKVLRGTAELVAGANTEHAKLSIVAGRERRPLTALPYRFELDPARGYVLVATRSGFRPTTIPLTFEDGAAQKQFVVSLRKWGDQGPVPEKAIAQRESITKKPGAKPIDIGTSAANTPSPADPPLTGVDSPVATEKVLPISAADVPTEPTAPTAASSFDGESRGTEFGVTATALLSINSIPHSNVLLDGRPLGATPRADVAVAPGEHVITFVHPELGRKQIVVTAIAGKALVAAVRFP